MVLLFAFLPFSFGLLHDMSDALYAVRYLMDIIWVLMMVVMVCYGRYARKQHLSKLVLWVVAFLLITLSAFVVQYQSVLYYLWGVRNNFRFYVAFFAIAIYLQRDDVEKVWKGFDILFWISVALAVVQFFALGLKQDYLGGIFGTKSGVNGAANVFFLIVIVKSIVFCIERKEKIWLCLLKCVAALLIAALAEMKFFFVEVIVVIGLALLITNFSWRKLYLVIGVLCAILLGAVVLSTVFSNWDEWLSIGWFLETATSKLGYTGRGDVNRLNAISRVNELWLKEWTQRILGMGMGNCDTASYAILNTPFFQQYGDMHYTWFSYAITYLENGYVGLIFYFGFFVLVYCGILRIEKKSESMTQTYCRIGRIMAIMCMIISIYNNSLRTETGYMSYFVLAVPFALNNYEGSRDV